MTIFRVIEEKIIRRKVALENKKSKRKRKQAGRNENQTE